MPRQKLLEELRQLRQDLERDQPLDAKQRDALEEALAEVERLLEAEEDHDESLVDRLREAATDFEESHPNLTMAIGAVADKLSRLGI